MLCGAPSMTCHMLAWQIAAVAVLPPHPHLVGQYRAWQQGGHFYIQMELCTGGSLAHLLDAVRRCVSPLSMGHTCRPGIEILRRKIQ